MRPAKASRPSWRTPSASLGSRFLSNEAALLNYRHHYHAGNFADVVKHALWLRVLETLVLDDTPLTVLDTHAGAGLYDLEGDLAGRSSEAQRGVVRLMGCEQPPAVLRPLKRAIERFNADAVTRFYPGSPLLSVASLRPGDRYVGFELRGEDARALAGALIDHPAPRVSAQCVQADGYVSAPEAIGTSLC
jgi:23S rRNA (adenine2030-N6)-methyltransferase